MAVALQSLPALSINSIYNRIHPLNSVRGPFGPKKKKKGRWWLFFSVPLLQQEGSCCDPSSACQTCFSLSFLLESFHNDIRPSSRVRQRRRAGKCFVEGGPRLSLSGWPHLYAAIRRVV